MPKANKSSKPKRSAGPAGRRTSPASAPRKPAPVPRTTVWAGPDGEGPNGGVTQSLLHRWLTCRERSRLTLVEGLKPADTFSAPLEFGSMWHACEEAFANSGNPIHTNPVAPVPWLKALADYTVKLQNRYPFNRDEVHGWCLKCAALFPRYVEHWANHDDVKNRTPLLAEQSFDVPYRLPSGRTVRLRGKWDSVDLVGGGVWLQENKTKGTIDRSKIVRQLTFDLQTMFYLVALIEWRENPDAAWAAPVRRHVPIKGVRYNVVRRALHKTPESMLKKFEEDRAAGRVEEWFARWNVEITPTDVQRFRTRFLDPVLEGLVQWWDWIVACKEIGEDPFTSAAAGEDEHAQALHWQSPFAPHPYGAVEGGTDMDEAVMNGSTVGLRRVDNLFEELN